jgi:hypothetical protein
MCLDQWVDVLSFSLFWLAFQGFDLFSNVSLMIRELFLPRELINGTPLKGSLVPVRDPRCVAFLGVTISGTRRLCPEVSQIPFFLGDRQAGDQLCGLRMLLREGSGFSICPIGCSIAYDTKYKKKEIVTIWSLE